MNEVAFKPEYIFIVYDDIIRTYTPTIINKILSMKSDYSDFIDYTKIENATPHDIMWLSQIRTSYNILEYLGKKTFDYDMTLMNICQMVDNVYKDSPDMVIGSALPIMASQSFIKKIYIYAPNNKYVNQDILNICKTNKDNIIIVNGDFEDAINSIKDKITLYIVNDVFMADIIMSDSSRKYSDIMVAEYGYNYKLDTDKRVPVLKSDDIASRALDMGFRITMFMPTNREAIGK